MRFLRVEILNEFAPLLLVIKQFIIQRLFAAEEYCKFYFSDFQGRSNLKCFTL